MAKSRRTKAVSIPRWVMEEVWERDDHKCVLCGNPQASPVCHFIRRAHGGRGIPENIWTGCLECHNKYDHITDELWHVCARLKLEQYFKRFYPRWDERKLIYNKWEARYE